MPRRRGTWIVVFPLLLAFTGYTCLAITGTAQSDSEALAEAISSDPALRGGERFLALASSTSPVASDRWVVCSISRRQFRRLSRKYETSLLRLGVNGGHVILALIEGVEGNDEKRRLLRSLQVWERNCRVIERRGTFFFIFNPQVS